MNPQAKTSRHIRLKIIPQTLALAAILAPAEFSYAEGIADSARQLIQPETPKSATAATPTIKPEKSTAEEIAEAKAELAADEANGAAPPLGISKSEWSGRRTVLTVLIRLHEQCEVDLAALKRAREDADTAERRGRDWSGFETPPPYSVLFADALRETLQTEERKLTSATKSDPIRESQATELRRQLANATQSLRQLREKTEGTVDPGERAKLEWRLRFGQLRERMTLASIRSFELENEALRERLREGRAHSALLRRQLAVAEAAMRTTDEDRRTVARRIEAETESLRNELTTVMKESEAVTRAEREAAARLEKLKLEKAADAIASATAEAEAAEAALETFEKKSRVLRLLLDGVELENILWQVRFAAADGNHYEILRDAAQKLDALTDRIDLCRNSELARIGVDAASPTKLAERLNALPENAPERAAIRRHIDTLLDRDRAHLRFIRTIDRLKNMSQRFREALLASETKLSFGERLRSIRSAAESFGRSVWNLELLAIDDSMDVDGKIITGKRSITVGKVTLALGILIAGIWVSSRSGRMAEYLIIRRFRVDANQVGLIRRWLQALIVIGLIVLSLLTVKIPLSIFAFAGGTLALGLGFGTQTLLKNFACGLILLFERPFKVGDTLDIGGVKGTLRSIGLRASVLRLRNDTDTIIPNSTLLENNVTNWNYSNNHVRFGLKVGVAYGADPLRVMSLITSTAMSHPEVKQFPEPHTLFVDFGDNSLNFELRYWIDAGPDENNSVSSDLRVKINAALNEAGIAIPFPQRDVHLDAAKPIPVTVVATKPDLAPQREAGTDA